MKPQLSINEMLVLLHVLLICTLIVTLAQSVDVAYVTISIFYKDSILVCRRGVRDHDYGKIYSCGGHIDPGEDDITASVREVYEESGLRLSRDELQYFSEGYGKHGKIRRDFIVKYNDAQPSIPGAVSQFQREIMNVDHILDVPTVHGWAFVPVLDLMNYFEKYPHEGKSSFGKLFYTLTNSSAIIP